MLKIMILINLRSILQLLLSEKALRLLKLSTWIFYVIDKLQKFKRLSTANKASLLPFPKFNLFVVKLTGRRSGAQPVIPPHL